MSLQTNVSDLATRVATELKAHKVLINNNAADLSALTTTNKSNLVAAINELVGAIGGAGASIDDGTISTLTVWSSDKTDEEIDARIDALVNAAPGALDTLDELAAALGDDPNFATTITNALAAKAPLASPALTGTPTAPTASAATNTTQIATTAFVQTSNPAASETVAGHVELATAAETTTGTDNTRAVHPQGLKVELDKKATIASPTFTGTPAAPTASASTNTTQIATTAFVQGEISGKAPLASPAFTGNPTAPTPSAADNDTSIATTAFVQTEISTKANLASPTFTGTPLAPTAANGTNTTQIATTAFVQDAANGNRTKAPVRVATTAAGTLATSFENGDTIDGITLATGNRILIKNQAAPAENGIYTVNASGAPTRATDADSGAELTTAEVYVKLGTVNAATTWVQQSDITTVGTDSQTWANLLTGYATLASPTFTGTPAAPTAVGGTNTTQIATTAFVTSAISSAAGSYQALDSDLTALAGISSNGILAHTGSGTAAARTITGTSPVGVTNGDGVSGNPTIAVSAASSTAQGVVELATDAETITGTDTARAITPANLLATLGNSATNFVTVFEAGLV